MSENRFTAPATRALRVHHRHLPHWQVGGSIYFITFRIAAGITPLTTTEKRLVGGAILYWHSVEWEVHAFTVMPDHVHIIAMPSGKDGRWRSLSRIMQSVKRWSARQINLSRGQRGSLWQNESFDRIIRDQREYDEKLAYVLNNAVKAELVEDAWSYEGLWCYWRHDL